MRSDHKSLSDLFRAARSEAGPDLVKPDEIQQLLGNPVMPHVPLTSRIGQHLSKRLLSTPFRLGATMMTTATLATIGAITLRSLLFGSASQDISKQDLVHFMPSKAAASVVESPQYTYKAPDYSRVGAITKSSVQNAVPDEVRTIAKVSQAPESDSLEPIDLSVDQLARLGIILSDNGDIKVYEKVDNGITPYVFPSTGGLRFGSDKHLTLQDIPSAQVLETMPRLITKSNGAKLLYAFENDTNFPYLINNILSLIDSMNDPIHIQSQIGQKLRIGVGDSVMEQIAQLNIDSVIRSFGIDLSKIDPSKVKANVEVSMFGTDTNSPKYSSEGIDSMLRSLSVDPSKINGKGKMSIGFSWSIEDTNSAAYPSIDSMLRAFGIDTAIKSKVGVHVIGTEDKESTEMEMPVLGTSIHNLPKGFQHSIKKFQDMVGDFQHSMDAEIKLDSLIPIRVRNLNNPNHPNELIFWYAPTPEVTNLLPRAASVSSSKPQHVTLSVYPNPTNGPAIVHYELKDVSRADFSIYNLLGEKLLDGGSTNGLTGDSKIDLSSLDAGMYLLITTTDNGDRDIERIVLAK